MLIIIVLKVRQDCRKKVTEEKRTEGKLWPKKTKKRKQDGLIFKFVLHSLGPQIRKNCSEITKERKFNKESDKIKRKKNKRKT